MIRRAAALSCAAALAGSPAASLAAQDPKPVATGTEFSCVLWVKDLDRSIGFYERVLGCTMHTHLPKLGWAELWTPAPGVRIGLARGPGAKAGAGITPTFHVADIAVAQAALEEHEIQPLGPVTEMPGLCMLLSFADPDGHALQFVQPLATAAAAQPAVAPAASDDPMASVAFLAGSWRMTQGDAATEEHWTEPLAGKMLGTARVVKGERTMSFEFLRIERRGEKLFYVAQPGGRPPTDFELVSTDGGKLVFANPAHDFPKRVMYWLQPDGMLRARVDDGSDDGKALNFGWRRVK